MSTWDQTYNVLENDMGNPTITLLVVTELQDHCIIRLLLTTNTVPIHFIFRRSVCYSFTNKITERGVICGLYYI